MGTSKQTTCAESLSFRQEKVFKDSLTNGYTGQAIQSSKSSFLMATSLHGSRSRKPNRVSLLKLHLKSRFPLRMAKSLMHFRFQKRKLNSRFHCIQKSNGSLSTPSSRC